ncbi:MAG: hypothetical protein RR338_05255 [Clostridia bacterium]
MKYRKPKIKRPLLTLGNETKNQIMLSHYDPNGSYTGVPTSPSESVKPTQDADDL